jgi:hypothetical protein
MRREVATAIAVCLVAAAISTGYTEWRLARILQTRPPIVVIDYSAVAKALQDGRPVTEIEPVFAQLKAAAAKLRAQGFLVVNGANLEGAPEHLIVRASPPAPPAKPLAAPPAADEGIAPDVAAKIVQELFPQSR